MEGKYTFELVKQIGSGQFSEVYKAKWINAPLTPPCPPSPGVLSSLLGPLESSLPADSQIAQPLIYSDSYNSSSSNNNNNSNISPDNFHHPHQQQGDLTSPAGFKIASNYNPDPNQHQANQVVYGEKFVALKKIKFYEIQNSQLRMDCIKEIRLLQQLNHPNIINYNISFEVRHELYIVLELADGGDISKLIKYFQKRDRLMNEKTILKYFKQICSAVRYIHSKRILHRDIKPANIFMTSDGCVKLGDFGLGRFFSQNTRDAHTLVGTFYYMSPERILESGYGFSSDIWSLGCVLYELITLHSPFSIMNIQKQQQQDGQQQLINGSPYNLQWLCDRIIRADYPSLANYCQISPTLRQLATECLNPNPNMRPNMEYICQVVGEAHHLQQCQQVV